MMQITYKQLFHGLNKATAGREYEFISSECQPKVYEYIEKKTAVITPKEKKVIFDLVVESNFK